ncbi:hypothetical protein DPM13_00900 [Paracoccus mutanolyticus]|uniref:TRAP C4-dicarboxylate transport system permease DctM subunit domain-containing protein n=1 Tax=Paracoccus mutanolyticus TaxID=1499308 RepID=A0ABM6WNZ5_9RHOB|nr:TRAP transporter large permease subunit [Paracoccus mutanolyticus]AWX92323.1 hypothetical protein DPM13_00900 [Paracoccus mutanolyticus]
MGRLFNNIGIWTAGGYSAGPAKVCVISSGLFGTMSGSSVANVVVSGQFTIPMASHRCRSSKTGAARALRSSVRRSGGDGRASFSTAQSCAIRPMASPAIASLRR